MASSQEGVWLKGQPTCAGNLIHRTHQRPPDTRAVRGAPLHVCAVICPSVPRLRREHECWALWNVLVPCCPELPLHTASGYNRGAVSLGHRQCPLLSHTSPGLSPTFLKQLPRGRGEKTRGERVLGVGH